MDNGDAFGPGCQPDGLGHCVSSQSGIPIAEEAAEPDDVVWLRDLDGTGSMHVCTPHCPGAIRYFREGSYGEA